jgi:hypothetical protein
VRKDAGYWSLPARHQLRFRRWQAGILDLRGIVFDLSRIRHQASSIGPHQGTGQSATTSETGGMRKAPKRGQKPMPYKDISNSNIEIRMTKQYQMTKIRMPET